MAYATCDQYGKAEVSIDSAGMIKIGVKGSSIHMSPQEAAQAVEAEGAQA